jgi:hypothetical protein
MSHTKQVRLAGSVLDRSRHVCAFFHSKEEGPPLVARLETMAQELMRLTVVLSFEALCEQS